MSLQTTSYPLRLHFEKENAMRAAVITGVVIGLVVLAIVEARDYFRARRQQ
jgi:hypothetical protein